MKALLNNIIVDLNALTDAQVSKVALEQRTEYNGVWYFNPSGAVLITVMPSAQPSQYHTLKSNYQEFEGAEQWEVVDDNMLLLIQAVRTAANAVRDIKRNELIDFVVGDVTCKIDADKTGREQINIAATSALAVESVPAIAAMFPRAWIVANEADGTPMSSDGNSTVLLTPDQMIELSVLVGKREGFHMYGCNAFKTGLNTLSVDELLVHKTSLENGECPWGEFDPTA